VRDRQREIDGLAADGDLVADLDAEIIEEDDGIHRLERAQSAKYAGIAQSHAWQPRMFRMVRRSSFLVLRSSCLVLRASFFVLPPLGLSLADSRAWLSRRK
jgi:hypothetical protein